jgi:Protein of unknown function (DUF1118)
LHSCFIKYTNTAAIALSCSLSAAFVPATHQPRFGGVTTAQQARVSLADEVDTVGNNVQVKELLLKVEKGQLLSKVAASGLLSKAQDAGITLSKLEPLLALAADNPDILILVEASGPEVLPLLPTLVDLAPGALPLLAAAVGIPSAVLSAAGVAALAAAGGAIYIIPDDTVVNVALQTLAVGLAVPTAGAALIGGAILGKLTK